MSVVVNRSTNTDLASIGNDDPITHEDAVHFEDHGGVLKVYGPLPTQGQHHPIAVYARECWRSAVVVAAQENPAIELVIAKYVTTSSATDLYGGDEPAAELQRVVGKRKVLAKGILADNEPGGVRTIFAVVSPQGDVGAE